MKQLKCTSCGASLHVQEGQKTVKCEYCGAENRLEEPTVINAETVNVYVGSEGLVLNQAEHSDEIAGAEEPSQEAQEQTAKPPKSKARTLTIKIAITAVFAAMSFGLYLLGKFCKLPFLFPSFLDLQFSELPALIVGYALGPVYGAAVIVVKCLLKMPMTSTGFVGELTDIVLGLLLVLPASILYRFKRNLKGAILGALLGSFFMIGGAILLNRFVSIPFYLKTFFDGNWDILLGMLKGLFPKINQQNFYRYYLWCSVLPFNFLRCLVMCLLTFGVYKRLSKLIHRITM